MEVKSGFRDPEKVSLSTEQRRPFNGGKRYKGYENSFLGSNFVYPELRCPKGRFPLYKQEQMNSNPDEFLKPKP